MLLLALLVGASQSYADWIEEGIPVCSKDGVQSTPGIVRDGSHGAIIAWRDSRTGSRDIYLQRIGPYGWQLWSAAGVRLGTSDSDKSSPRMVSDGSGGAVLAYTEVQDEPYTLVTLQRIDGSGAVRWNPDGIDAAPVYASQFDPALAADGAGGAFVVWEDWRWGAAVRSVYVQRVASDGTLLWGPRGMKVSDRLLKSRFLSVISDGAGGAVIVWVFPWSGGWRLYARRIDGDGAFLWSGDIEIAAGPYVIQGFSVSPDGSGGAIVAWDEARESYPQNRIAVQRVDGNAAVSWTEGGITIFASFEYCGRPRIVPAGDDGVIAVWELENGDAYWQRAQRIDADGTLLWQTGGAEACYTADSQLGLRLVPDGAGGAISVWSEERDPGYHDIVAQRIDADGDFKWTITGRRITSADYNHDNPALSPDDRGGAIIAWEDKNATSLGNIYAQRITAQGNLPPITRLKVYTAFASGYDVVVEWSLDEAGPELEFSVCRAVGPDGVFQEVVDPGIESNGLSYTFIDKNQEPATTYRYRIDVSDEAGTRNLFETEPVTTPSMPVTLYQNYPNPFNPQTTIYYYLPAPSRVILEVYDVAGRRLAEVFDGWRIEGHHAESWDGSDAGGDPLPAGVYFLRLRSWVGEDERKLVIVR